MLACALLGCADSRAPAAGAPDDAARVPAQDGGAQATPAQPDTSVARDASVGSCAANDADTACEREPEDWSAVASPLPGTAFALQDDGILVLYGGDSRDPCVITPDGCAELRLEFDADGCLLAVRGPFPWGGETAEQAPSPYPPDVFPGLVECNRERWTRQRWPCLVDRTVLLRETCFE